MISANWRQAVTMRSSFAKREKMRRKPLSLRNRRAISWRLR
jgi:hypothetical protein